MSKLFSGGQGILGKNSYNIDVTMLILTYNHEDYIELCLDSAFKQTYESMKILIWDNCSTDNTLKIIKQFLANYSGGKQVYLYESQKNLYPGYGFINKAVPMIDSNFIVFLSGDDISGLTRVEELVAARRRTGANVLSSANIEIDVNGRQGKYVSTLVRKNRTAMTTLEQFIKNGGSSTCVGSGLAFDKAVFDYFGPLRDGPRNIDVIIPFRGTLLNCNYYIDKPLVYRRIHPDNVALGKTLDKKEQLVIKEKQLSNRTANFVTILEDFDFFAKKNPKDPRNFSKLRTSLVNRLSKITKRWVQHRHSMMMKGIGIV